MVDAEWRLLAEFPTPFQAKMVRDALESEGIPVLVRQPGSGSYVTILFGQHANVATELHVPADRLLEAQKLLEGLAFAGD